MRKHFCAAPWAGLSLDPDGKSKVCCINTARVSIDQFKDVKNKRSSSADYQASRIQNIPRVPFNFENDKRLFEIKVSRNSQ